VVRQQHDGDGGEQQRQHERGVLSEGPAQRRRHPDLGIAQQQREGAGDGLQPSPTE